MLFNSWFRVEVSGIENLPETGAALVGIEISSREAYEPLWGRMKASPLKIQLVAPGSTAYRVLV